MVINKRLLITSLLGFSSGLPLGLLTSTLQAWFADQGMSVLTTGLLSLIGLPYALRVLWSPLVDKYYFSTFGRRKSWMLLTQSLLVIGFISFCWLSPTQDVKYISLIAVVLACLSATQDVVVEAQRIEYLPLKWHGLGAAWGVSSYRIALLISSGLALIIAQHGGWSVTFFFMSLLMFVGVGATLWSKEPHQSKCSSTTFVSIFIDPVKDLLARPGCTYLILFILFYKAGEVFTATTSGIMMPFLINGLHFSLQTIGYVNKILGITTLLVGGIIAGIFLVSRSLYKALFLFGLLQALANLLFVALATSPSIVLLVFAVGCDNLAAGMGSTALVALLMRVVNRQFTATQFSILAALSTLPRTFSGPIAACMQMHLGWRGLFQCSFLIALVYIPFLIKIKNWTRELKV